MKITYLDESELPEATLPEIDDELLWTGLDTWLGDWEGGSL